MPPDEKASCLLSPDHVEPSWYWLVPTVTSRFVRTSSTSTAIRVPLPSTIRVNAMCVPSGDGTGHQSYGAGAGAVAAAAGTATASTTPIMSSALHVHESYAAGIRDR